MSLQELLDAYSGLPEELVKAARVLDAAYDDLSWWAEFSAEVKHQGIQWEIGASHHRLEFSVDYWV